MQKTSNFHSKINTNIITSIFVLAVCGICLDPEISHAITSVDANVKGNTALGGIYDNLKGIVTGAGGKIIALSSLLLGLAAAAATSSIKVLFPTGGIALAVGAGPSVIENVIGAVF